MATHTITLHRNAIVRQAGLALGILVMNPDETDPAARIMIRDTATHEQQVAEIRPGDHLTALGRTIQVSAVTPGWRAAGSVALVIEDPPGRPQDGERQ